MTILELNANSFYCALSNIHNIYYGTIYPLELFIKMCIEVASSNKNINIKKLEILVHLYSSLSGRKYFGNKFDLKNLEYIQTIWYTLQCYFYKLDIKSIQEKILTIMDQIQENEKYNENDYLNFCDDSKSMMDVINAFNDFSKFGYLINLQKYYEREDDKGEIFHIVRLHFEK